MSKPKGRRRPLHSEITSLRQPTDLAEAESSGAEVALPEPSPTDGAPPASDVAPAPLELGSEEPEPAATEAGGGRLAPEAAAAPPDAAGSFEGDPEPAPFEQETFAPEDGEREFDGPSNVITIDGAERDDMEEFLSGLIEALLFTSQKPLELKEIARSAGIDRPRARELLERLTRQYANRGINIDEVAGGYVLRSSPRYAPQIQKFLALRPVRLSRAQLETLAIVAYRQPVTKPEVDEIRGVDSGQVIKGLLERSLLKIVGKKDEPGRPSLYGTTNDFLELLNLKSLSELPTLREYTELSEESRRKFAEETGEEAPEELPTESAAGEAAATEAAATEAAETPAAEAAQSEAAPDVLDASAEGEVEQSTEVTDAPETVEAPSSEEDGATDAARADDSDDDEDEESDDDDDDSDEDDDEESDDDDDDDDESDDDDDDEESDDDDDDDSDEDDDDEESDDDDE